MHPPYRREVAPCADSGHAKQSSYMYLDDWPGREPPSPFLEQAASLGGGSRWLEAGQKLPRFHRKALIFDVSSQVASELPSTGWLPVQCYLVGISEK